ncbi:MAG: LysM domain-containing protein [Patescibacteria group bacterium]
MRLKRAFIAIAAFIGVASAAFAQDSSPLSLASVRHHNEGVDHVFEFDIANASDRPVTARGRLVVINVYDASLPTTVQIREITVPAGGKSTVTARWDDAPLIGQVRTLLVLNDGQHASLVESRSFWILPLAQAAMFVGVAVLAAAIALAAMRLPKYLKNRVPPNMELYIAEFDDTVVTLAGRYDVTWQDIVRANRLRPPYALKPGSRVFIPKHALRRREAPPEA